MLLEVRYFQVKEVVFSDRTRYVQGVLEVNRDDLVELALRDGVLQAVDIQVVHPGESARIIHVLDTVEPRCKVEGKGCAFPGFLGPPETVGSG
ncbi:MAG TPA: beta-aspartyl-peptidase, partial [Firmicutes bacterium]|nr:beta-aspartyl-peptidase [Bacillota bacterium]